MNAAVVNAAAVPARIAERIDRRIGEVAARAPGFAELLRDARDAAKAPTDVTAPPARAMATGAVGSGTNARVPLGVLLGTVPAVAPSSPRPPAAPAGPTPDWADAAPAAARPWAPAIEDAATRHGLDPRLLAALVWTESSFDPTARSSAGAIGLTQLMPATAAGLGVDPTDPAQNLDGGARYLRSMLDRFGDLELALAAYNAGPGRVMRAGGIPDIAETRRYVPTVIDRYRSLGGTP